MRRWFGLILGLGVGVLLAGPAEAQYWYQQPAMGGRYFHAPSYAYRTTTYPGLLGTGLYRPGMPGFSYGNTYGTASFAQPGYLGYTTYAAPTSRTYTSAYNGYVAPGTGSRAWASPWYGTSYYYPYAPMNAYPRYDYSAFGAGAAAPSYYRASPYGYSGFGWGGYGGWYR